MGTMNSLIEKLKWKNLFGSHSDLRQNTVKSQIKENTSTEKSQEEQTAHLRSLHLRSLNDDQFGDFVSQMSERAVIRLLQTLTDQELQLRVVGEVTNEAALK